MINIFSPINNLGMGIHGYNMCKALQNLGEEICLVPPLGQVRIINPDIEKWQANRDHFKRHNPGLMIFDIDWLTQFSGAPRIGFAVFETDGFTPRQIAAMRSCDSILTPSRWGQRVLKHYAIESMVIHEGYDPEIYHLGDLLHEDSKIKFLHVGKFEERKGTIQTIRAFFLALERQDAELVLHCHNPFIDGGGYNDILKEISRLGFTPSGFASYEPITRFVKAGLSIFFSYPAESIANLYLMADCCVFPSRGEGWGLPLMESIVSGTPAITGNWTGQSEYLGEDYPRELTLRDYSIVPANDGIWYYGDRGNWIIPEMRELVDRIAWAHQNVRKFRRSERWKEKVEDIRSFTWEKAAKDFILYLKEIVV